MLQTDLHDFSCFLPPLLLFFMTELARKEKRKNTHSRKMQIATCAVPNTAVTAPC